MRRHVRGGELRQLVRLRVDPAQRLHAAQVLVLWQGSGQVDCLVRAPLRHEHNAADLFDLRIVGRRDPVQVRRDLRPKIADHDESFEHVLGENVLRRDKQRTSTGVENAWRAR